MEVWVGQALMTAIGAAASYVFAVRKARSDLIDTLSAEYDKSLREERLSAYRLLWAKLETLAVYSPPEPLTLGHLELLSTALREWYFGTGGIFLSRTAQASYIELQEYMQRVLRARSAHDRSTALRECDSRETKADQENYIKERLVRGSGSQNEKPYEPGADPKLDAYVIIRLASRLRTALTSDVQSRAASLIEQVD